MPTVTVFPNVQRDPATVQDGKFDSSIVNVNKLAGQDVAVIGSVQETALSDPNFHMSLLVLGTNDPSGPVPETSWKILQSEDYTGGNVTRFGNKIQPAFAFRSSSIGDNIVRLMLRVVPNGIATWSISVSVP